MFVISLKMSKLKIAIASFAVILIGAILTFSLYNINTTDVSTKNVKTTLLDNSQRIEFLKSFGWEVSKEATEVVEVVIPNEFDDVYKKYDEIQKKQGYDLLKYKGKRVKRWTYDVLNYPDGKVNIKANILTYENKVIAGDICSVELDGLMHGFKLVAK